MAMADSSSESEFWGWESFFHEINKFLRESGRQFGKNLVMYRLGLSNLLNKIQFTFEVVPCLILGLFRRFFRRCASILAQCYKGVGGREEGRVGWGGREEEKPPQVKTRGD